MKALRHSVLAVWLGMIAVAVTALMPVYLVPELAIAATRTALPCHDDMADARGHTHKGHSDCAICGGLGSLAAVAGASPPAMLLPSAVHGIVLTLSPTEVPAGALRLAYLSRGPPATA